MINEFIKARKEISYYTRVTIDTIIIFLVFIFIITSYTIITEAFEIKMIIGNLISISLTISLIKIIPSIHNKLKNSKKN